MTILQFTREQFVDALEARRPLLQRKDAANLAAHKKAEAACLKQFREQCREAARWDYETAKAKMFTVSIDRYHRPQCPRSLVVKLDEQIRIARATQAKNVRVGQSGQWSAAFWLLTMPEHDEPAEMC